MMIASPKDEPPPNGYAVIYALDGDALFLTLAETVKLAERMQPLSEKGIQTESVKFAGEDHVSVLPAILIRIPRLLWS